MSALESLLTQYSIESILIFLIGIVLAFKFLSELWDWAYNRIRNHFNIKTDQQQQEAEDREHMDRIEQKLDELSKDMHDRHDKLADSVAELKDKQRQTTDRLQENTRSYIIDKHHFLCYQMKQIDDLTLQSLERRYMFYKADGGDSFIDQLMEELRELPRVMSLPNMNDNTYRDGIM